MKSFRKKTSIIKFILFVFIFFSGIFFQRYGVYGEYIYPLFENYIFKYYEYQLKGLKPLDKINISITKKNYSKFEKSRKLAIKFKRNYRTHSENPGYIDAKLLTETQEKIPIKFKLTGGRAVHYNNPDKKYSLKIKSINNFKGFTKFSLLNPPARHFLNEWFFHKFNSYNQLISDKFEFVKVYINNKYKGIYSFEGYPNQCITEVNSKKLSPIFCYDADVAWNLTSELDIIPAQLEIFKRGNLKPLIKKNIINENPKLQQLYSLAFKKMELFKDGKIKLNEVFNLDKMAMLFAETTLFGDFHSLGLWNLKFYLNPETLLVEPIPFDQTYITKKMSIRNVLLPYKEDTSKINMSFKDRFLSDTGFYRKYIKNTSRLCEKYYLEKFIKTIEKEKKDLEKVLNIEYSKYNFNLVLDKIIYNRDFIKSFFNGNQLINVSLNKKINNKKLKLSFENNFISPVKLVSVIINKERIPVNLFMLPYFNEVKYFKEFRIIDEKDVNISLEYKIFGIENIKVSKFKLKNSILYSI
jgi:hypothetical protein